MITEQYVLNHLDRIPEDKLESVFFPQFKGKLDSVSVPVNVTPSHYCAVQHKQPISFDEWKAKHYDKLRKYPSIEEQLDYIYHNGVEAWARDMIDPVKQKVPKPVSV